MHYFPGRANHVDKQNHHQTRLTNSKKIITKRD